MQGKAVTDPEALADLRDFGADESCVEVPADVLRLIDRARRAGSSPASSDRIVRTYRYTAGRLEQRDCYNTDSSPELLRRFLAGEVVDYSFMDTWTGRVNRWRAEGERIVRGSGH